MKLIAFIALGSSGVLAEVTRDENVRAQEMVCMDKISNMFENFTLSKRDDGIYVNEHSIKHFVGPIKYQWNKCMEI